jgi:hypothetical protein
MRTARSLQRSLRAISAVLVNRPHDPAHAPRPRRFPDIQGTRRELFLSEPLTTELRVWTPVALHNPKRLWEAHGELSTKAIVVH